MRTASLWSALGCLAAISAALASQPTFLARRDYQFASSGIAVADTNGDKIPDIIGGSGEQITTLLGNGNGTFRQGPVSTTGIVLVAYPLAADLNRDGKVDVVTAAGEYSNGGIGVSLGNGDGTFQPAVFYQAGSDRYLGNPVLGDFNGDGILDAVIAGESGIWLFTGKGDGTLNPAVLIPMSSNGGGQAVAADFNGDGKLDLAITTITGFDVLLGNGNGTFQAPKAFTAPYGGLYIAVGDLNSDGAPDIALDYGLPHIAVYLNNGSGGFSSPTIADLPTFGSFAVGDVNGDGIPDLVSGAGYIALGRGNGTFKPPRFYPALPTSITATFVALADLRHKGLTDLVFQGFGVSVLLSFGKGKFEDGEWTKVAGGAGCGASADYNGDGKPDLAVNTPAGVSILLGTGNALSPFKPGATLALSYADCLVTGDLNGDGIPDLLVPSNQSTVVAYLGNGDGTFTQKSVTSTPAGGYLALGDFNHDRKLDFATSGNLLVLGNGDGTFQTPVTLVTGPLPYGGFTNLATGDLNGDGWDDLVMTSYYDSYIYVLLNNQHGGFTQTSFHAMNANGSPVDPGQVLLVDLNADGKLDMVVGGANGGATVYLGDGKGGFTYKQELSVNGRWAGPLAAVADVNGDGIPDVVTGAGTIGIYLGRGDGTFKTPYYIGAGPSPGDLVLENLHGQPTGFPDIVAPDVTGGVMVLINATR